jgi:uncharacterized membrane protein YqgA involved in biofilm formation
MQATIVNCIAIIAGTFAGILFSRKITDELSDIISSAAGIITLIIGFQMAFATENVIYMALALIIGGILGTWWDIDGKILALGRFLEYHFGGGKARARGVGAAVSSAESSGTPVSGPGANNRFAYAFLNSSVLFCVGAMAILGSFKAGTEGDFTILYTKSVLDGFLAIVFGAAMGVGTAFSALSILIYQGGLTLLSVFVKPWVTTRMIHELTGIGGALVVMIGINLLNLRKLKTANYLPGLIIIILFVIADPFFTQIAAHFV